MPVNKGVFMEKGLVFSTKLLESVGYVDPNSLSLRTWQHSLLEETGHGSVMSSEDLPKSGMMRNGKLYGRVNLGCPMEEKGCGLLPTPRRFMAYGALRKKKEGEWADVKNLEDVVGGRPDPNLVEWMMGFPKGWTDLNA